MTPQELRLKCLELAVRPDYAFGPVSDHNQSNEQEDIVSLAARYEAFVLNGEKSEEKPLSAKVKPKKEESKSTKLEELKVEKVADDGGETVEVTYDQVKTAILEVAKKHGRDGSLDLLAPFGVVKGEGIDRKGNMNDLKPEQYADVLSAAQKMLI